MFGDTAFVIERSTALAIVSWGAAAFAAGVSLLVIARRVRSAQLVRGAGEQLLWPAVLELIVGGIAYATATIRDYAGAVRLDHLLWLASGLSIGFVVVGATASFAGFRLGARERWIGGGAALALHGGVIALVLSLALRRLAL